MCTTCAPLVHHLCTTCAPRQSGRLHGLLGWLCGVAFILCLETGQNSYRIVANLFFTPKDPILSRVSLVRLWGTVDCFCFAVSPFRLHWHRIKEWLDIIPPFTIASIRIADVEYDAPISPWVIIAGWFSMILGVCSSPYLSLATADLLFGHDEHSSIRQ